MPTKQFSESLNNLLQREFSDVEKLQNSIDVDAIQSLKEAEDKPNLRYFFGMDESGPYSEFYSKGLRSLRQGFYKICRQPFYDDRIDPKTFAAKVYYFHPDNTNRIIEYEANVGPLTNKYCRYSTLPFTISPLDPAVEKFKEERNQDDYRTHYFKSKNRFFNTLYQQGRIFCVINSVWEETEPSFKRVTWSFIDPLV